MRLSWGDVKSRQFETGVDRGVFYPKDAPAVAWNGLTGVEQKGSETSTAYYLDGRPFLFVPKIKEYQATLKAYTYPDEFSAVMGLVEITDGMYVDSQQSDSFDLCYRTLIGNSTQGTKFGYKIHLIYNATADQQGTTYGALEDQVNAVDFSWDINAVPVPVTNYHPTAHIIIDTRHLDETKIKAIEDLLYGTETTTVVGLPRPETIYDLMNYGDGVVIVDNGDGTWTASGNYLDVVVGNDGEFILNNVDATFYDDGEYYFGPTPPDPGGGTPVPTGDIDGGTPSRPTTYEIDGGTPSQGGTVTVDGGGV